MSQSFVILTLACAVLTFATRIGGYLVLSRFERIPPRVQAALDAVPAAVLTTLFAPFLLAGWREALTLAVVALLGLRFGLVFVIVAGAALIVGLRQIG